MRTFWILYVKEIKEIIRDRRSIMGMVVIPALAIPLIVGVVGAIMARGYSQLEQKVFPLALGGEPPPGLELRGFSPFPSEDPRRDVEEGLAPCGLLVLKREGAYACSLFVDITGDEGRLAGERLSALVKSYGDTLLAENMRELGVPDWAWRPLSLVEVSVVPKGKEGFVLAIILGYLVVLLTFTGGMYPAMDLVAGERERHTLEILLSEVRTPLAPAMAKLLAVATAGSVTALVNLASLFLAARGLLASFGAEGASIGFSVSPAGVGLSFLVVLPVALFAAGLEVAVASLAKSYREAQTYVTPLSLVAVVPALLSLAPGFGLSPAECLVPIYNAAQLIRLTLLGQATPLQYILVFGANILYALAGGVLAAGALSREGIITG